MLCVSKFTTELQRYLIKCLNASDAMLRFPSEYQVQNDLAKKS